MYIAQYIVAQSTGNAGDKYNEKVDKRRFLPAPAEVVHARSYKVLKHRYYSGEACECHEYEEQRTPDPASLHQPGSQMAVRGPDQLPGNHCPGRRSAF